MDDIVNLKEVRERVKTEKVCSMFEDLTAEFATWAATYLEIHHPEIWNDDTVNSVAQMIVTAFLCKDAFSVLTQLAEAQASSPEEYARLCEILIPKEKEGE
jgi:hypothetical protein